MNRLKAAQIARAEGFVEGISWSAPFNKITAHFLNRCFVYERQKPMRRKVKPRSILFLGDRDYFVEHNRKNWRSATAILRRETVQGFQAILRCFKEEIDK